MGPQELVLVDVDKLVHGQKKCDIGRTWNLVPVLVLELVGLIRLDVLGEERPHAGNAPVQDVRQPEVERRLVERVRGAAAKPREKNGCQQNDRSPFHHLPPCGVHCARERASP